MMDGMKNTQEGGSALPAGTILRNRYRIEKPLGQGGFGITYRALDMKSHVRVAIKELFPSRNVERGADFRTVLVHRGEEDRFAVMRDRFEQEAKTLIQLQSQEGVVRLMHMFGENNTAYYVMELLEGEDLSKRLKREGTLSWEQMAAVLKPVLNALDQIHAVGLIHRDITPDNIFLTESGARLIDFGSVRAYQDGTHFTALVKQNFAPWEQFLSHGNQGPWTDIYSLSVTAYYALSGQLPPPAPDRRLNDKLIPLENLCPGLPRSACDAIRQGMAVSPEKRFQNVKQMRSALFQSGTGMTAEPHAGGVLCLRGRFAGKRWNLTPGSALRIGRNRDCDVAYPADFHGVSRAQCTIFRTAEGRYLIRDEGSSYGTRLQAMGKSVKLEPGKWYFADGAHVLFGAQEEYVMK